MTELSSLFFTAMKYAMSLHTSIFTLFHYNEICFYLLCTKLFIKKNEEISDDNNSLTLNRRFP